jgi:hypothetical protein
MPQYLHEASAVLPKDPALTTLSNAILSKVMDMSIRKKYMLAARAGLDAAGIPSAQDNAVVNPAIARAFDALDGERKRRALPILAEAIAADSEENRDDLIRLLGQHGYQYIDGKFLPIGLIDEREAQFLPAAATFDLSKAIDRLAQNDESGAITAACGALDATTTALYAKHNLGSPEAGFQAKVNTALNRLEVFEKLERELIEIDVKPEDARKIRDEMHAATKHAVEALQVIRRTNGDVHGTKPTYRRVVYDAIKWSSAVCGLFEGDV